ncbi:hypothetical protein [Lentzea sp. NPDC055074]
MSSTGLGTMRDAQRRHDGPRRVDVPDGGRTLTAALNYVDDADLSLAQAFQAVTKKLVEDVFG